MSKDKHSSYLKRRAKRMIRAAETGMGGVKPYAGTKYQQEEWVPLVYATESAVYDTIRMTDGQLKNDTVQAAFTKLSLRLRNADSPTLSPDEPQPKLVLGDEGEFIVWLIRDRWTTYFAEKGQVSADDLIGILRTLLHSIKAHEWYSGRSQGYVAFLQDFMQGKDLIAPRYLP